MHTLASAGLHSSNCPPANHVHYQLALLAQHIHWLVTKAVAGPDKVWTVPMHDG